MVKEFKTISELIKDDIFIQKVKEVLDEMVKSRLSRPEPKTGFIYKRDWYDRLTSENQLNVDFFLQHVESVWNRKSSLNSEKRRLVQHVCDHAVYRTNEHYNSMEPDTAEVYT